MYVFLASSSVVFFFWRGWFGWMLLNWLNSHKRMRFLRRSALALSRSEAGGIPYNATLSQNFFFFWLGFRLVGLLLAVCIYDLYEILLLLLVGMPRSDWKADFPPVATPTTLTSDKFPRFQREILSSTACCYWWWCFFSSTRRETVFTSFRFFGFFFMRFIDFFAVSQKLTSLAMHSSSFFL